MGNHVRVDQSLCISSGKCVADHPSAFRFDAHELSETTEQADELDDDEMIAAARNCPSAAIEVHDDDGVEIDPW